MGLSHNGRRMGRPPKADRPATWTINLPGSLAAKYSVVLADPVRGVVHPNVRQNIIVPLLNRLWDAMLLDHQTIVVEDLVAYLRSMIEIREPPSNEP